MAEPVVEDNKPVTLGDAAGRLAAADNSLKAIDAQIVMLTNHLADARVRREEILNSHEEARKSLEQAMTSEGNQAR